MIPTRPRLSDFCLLSEFYVLNIIDANVDAHLIQFNVNDNLSMQPNIIPNDFTTNQQNVGLTLNYRILMKIALLGYGKMGKVIERIALQRGHEIVLRKTSRQLLMAYFLPMLLSILVFRVLR